MSVSLPLAIISTAISFVHRREKFDAAVGVMVALVAHGSELSARQAKRSWKRGGGGGGLHLQSASMPAVASRLQDEPSAAGSGGVGGSPHQASASLPAIASRLHGKPSAAEIGGVGEADPTCGSNILKVGYVYSCSHMRVRERKAPCRAPADGAEGVALGRAGVWGQHPN
jgi:hypothetical protein